MVVSVEIVNLNVKEQIIFYVPNIVQATLGDTVEIPTVHGDQLVILG